MQTHIMFPNGFRNCNEENIESILDLNKVPFGLALEFFINASQIRVVM